MDRLELIDYWKEKLQAIEAMLRDSRITKKVVFEEGKKYLCDFTDNDRITAQIRIDAIKETISFLEK